MVCLIYEAQNSLYGRFCTKNTERDMLQRQRRWKGESVTSALDNDLRKTV